MQPKRGAILALGIPVGIVVAFLITSVIAWIYGPPQRQVRHFQDAGVLLVLSARSRGAESARRRCIGRIHHRRPHAVVGRKAEATSPRGCPLDRKSTRLNSVTNAHLVCRLLLEKKKLLHTIGPRISTQRQ